MKQNLIWATLIHLCTNLWYEEGNTRGACDRVWNSPASPTLRCDLSLLDEHLHDLQKAGCNAIVLDIGDALRFKSHPEIAVKDALSVEDLTALADKMRGMGFEIIPKLNFSTCHDYWLKDYSRMISTEVYYRVCADLIAEVCALLHPRYFHIGMDEENFGNQRNYDYIVIRNDELWWHDLNFIVDQVEKGGARAIMFADRAREQADDVIAHCRKSVVMCVWDYFNELEGDLDEYHLCRVRPFKQLADAGYDIIAGASVEYNVDNLEHLTDYCLRTLPKEQMLGSIQTTWASVMPEWKELLDQSVTSIANSVRIADEMAKNK